MYSAISSSIIFTTPKALVSFQAEHQRLLPHIKQALLEFWSHHPVDERGRNLGYCSQLNVAVAGCLGSLIVVALLVLRIYLGWAYVGDRLLSAAVPYEETGWCALPQLPACFLNFMQKHQKQSASAVVHPDDDI